MTQTPIPSFLSLFEIPPFLVEPALRTWRLSNAALDMFFYDTGVLTTELLWRGALVSTLPSPFAEAKGEAQPPAPIQGPSFSLLDLSALSNPEGCILVVDSTKAPFIRRFDRVDDFIAWLKSSGSDIEAVTVTGVGSSAFGSAAFAWNASMALGQRVAAIVPGYGVADVVYQGLGGWYGFGLEGWLEGLVHKMVASLAPSMARIGHGLLQTLPEGSKAQEGGEPFLTGNPASDVLHALLNDAPQISVLLGHSKGALVIENALRALDESVTSHLRVTTFGCPIGKSAPDTRYVQFLGDFDALGWSNSWGHLPNIRIPTHHSTNTSIPYSMPVAILSRVALAVEGAAEAAKLPHISGLRTKESYSEELTPAPL
jgi:hypothetical protein